MRMLSGFCLIVLASTLGLARPASAQPPARHCVAGPFMVFFDPNSDVVVPMGKKILDNVVAAYRNCGRAKVWIGGHTDRKGSDRDNLALSRRMASSVRAYLVQNGMPAELMALEGHGEGQLLVPTQDGVSEPTNRRVEIVFGPADAA